MNTNENRTSEVFGGLTYRAFESFAEEEWKLFGKHGLWDQVSAAMYTIGQLSMVFDVQEDARFLCEIAYLRDYWGKK